MAIDKTFAYHKPSDTALQSITALREAYTTLARFIEETCVPSRQRSVALTELETSAMWAIKAAVYHDPNSVAEIV